MSDTLVKAIRVGVQNSPKVSLCANPGHFLKVSTSHYQTSALLEAGHSPLISLSPGRFLDRIVLRLVVASVGGPVTGEICKCR